MIVFPAIDILGGAAVRLAQGDYERVTVYNNDPVAQARAWVEQGAEWVHVVDLDGARDGTPGNIDVVQAIVQHVGVPVQVGGGIRSHETLERLADAGASRMVLGTKLATDPQFVRDAVAAHGEAIVAGVDARGGEVQIAGWRKGARLPATELIAELSGLGVQHLVYTDVSRDGMQTGVDIDAYEAVAEVAGFPVVASGGIAAIEDIVALAALGPDTIEGAIVGRALYEGGFKLKHAIRAGRGEW